MMRIAVIHNTSIEGITCRFGRPSPEKYSPRTIQMVVDALRANGHTVASVEADKTMIGELERFIPPDAHDRPTGLVFNMAYGIQGDCRYTHVPGILEMTGIPYTGSSPLGHALALDKVITKILMMNAGVPTPPYCVMRRGDEPTDGLRFPLVVKPRHESTSYGLSLVYHCASLQRAVRTVVEMYQQDALVEEYIDGRELNIGILGDKTLEFLPPLELDFGNRNVKMNTWEDKSHRRLDEPKKICPAPLEPKFAERLREISAATFRACHLRDYARVDIRVDSSGRPFVLEVNSMAALSDSGSFVTAACQAGYTYTSLVQRIVEMAHERVRATPTWRQAPPALPAAPVPHLHQYGNAQHTSDGFQRVEKLMSG